MNNFSALNDKEFEDFARDILNAKFSLRLQSFRRGRDKGIDARYSTPTNLDNIFKVSVRLIYNTKKEDNSDVNFESDECKNYLENLVRIDVKKNNS